jgi:hypothetical protein
MRNLKRKISMSRKTALNTTIALAAIAGASTLALTGCKAPDPNQKYKTDLNSLSADLSPELFNTQQTHDEAWMDRVVNQDQDRRSAWSDFGRFWLTDKPRPTSPYPIMQTAGNP